MSVRLRGVSKTFGRVEALRDVDLDLEKGEVVGILGPNGSGKTTLLKLIAGLLLPDSGEMEVLGGSPRRLLGQIAYLPEVPFLPSWMGPREVERFMKGLFPVSAGKGIGNWYRRSTSLPALSDPSPRARSRGLSSPPSSPKRLKSTSWTSLWGESTSFPGSGS